MQRFALHLSRLPDVSFRELRRPSQATPVWLQWSLMCLPAAARSCRVARRSRKAQRFVFKMRVRSFLEQRSTTLVFDNQETSAQPTSAGVPQGSPLSPILFILYTASLYDALRPVPGIMSNTTPSNFTSLTAWTDTPPSSCRGFRSQLLPRVKWISWYLLGANFFRSVSPTLRRSGALHEDTLSPRVRFCRIPEFWCRRRMHR